MKKILSHLLVISILAGFGATALAETTASTTRPGNFKIPPPKGDDNHKTASSTAEVRGEGVRAREENHFGKALTRYQATIDREKSIMDKVNSRIQKMKTDGVGNTTTAEGLTAQAKTELDAAQTALNSLKLALDNAINQEIASSTATTVTKDSLKKMQQATVNIDKHIHLAHNDLVKAVSSLMRLYEKHNATSTVTTPEPHN